MAIETDENVGLAFGLVTGAGLATALGASVVFVPKLIQLANRRTLASALGFSAGVMTYVSFVEILVKSQISFQDSGLEDDKAYAYASVCFFAGVVFMVVSLDLSNSLSHSFSLSVCVCDFFEKKNSHTQSLGLPSGTQPFGHCIVRRSSPSSSSSSRRS